MKIVLFPTAASEWRSKGRLLGRVELSPTEAGLAQCGDWADEVSELGVKAIYHAPDELSAVTAETLGKHLDAARKAVEGLLEPDVGLWAGLTDAQLKARFAKAHRNLSEAPLNIRPPEGEPFSKALERLEAAIRKQIGRNGIPAIGFVLRPLALAMVRSCFEENGATEIYEMTRDEDLPRVFEADAFPQPALKP